MNREQLIQLTWLIKAWADERESLYNLNKFEYLETTLMQTITAIHEEINKKEAI